MSANAFITNAATRTLKKRLERIEQFRCEIGVEDPAQPTSRYPLEQPWSLSAQEFAWRSTATFMSHYQAARQETFALTETIQMTEREIDERVKALYGL